MDRDDKHDRMETEGDDDDRSKRVRVTGTNQTPRRLIDFKPRTTGDCYDEVMKGHTLNVNGSVRSSWLQNIKWLSMDDSTEIEPAAIPLPADAASQQVAMSTQMKALHHQLSQIKRRLWPASEDCSRADSQDPYVHFEQARRACNPLEVLGEGRQGGLNSLFMNRSAIKLANLNALLGFSLSRHDGKGPFVFADLCGAPGGFSEYILQHCRHPLCRGYGMSLVGSNEQGRGADWKIRNTNNYQTCYGADGTGDIYNWENVLALQSMVRTDCANTNASTCIEDGKVHLVLADGGFDAQRDSEHQEELAQKICICQAAAALTLLKEGGMFVMKMFGFRTAPIRTLMRNLMDAFDHIIAIKPISSRPASAERYVVFSGFKGTNNEFDGLKWRKYTFLGDTGRVALTDAKVKRARHLDNYLDAIDLDMVNLNLKTCFAILSHLQSRDGFAQSNAVATTTKLQHPESTLTLTLESGGSIKQLINLNNGWFQVLP
jgi:cap1 methyltransferase